MKEAIERFPELKKKDCNPWNKGLTKENHKSLKTISEKLQGRIIPQDVRLKQSKTRKKLFQEGKWIPPWLGKERSIEHRENLSKSLKGRIISEETRRKMSKGGMGRIVSDKHKKILRELMMGNTVWKGRKHTEESKKKISISHIGKKLKPHTKEQKQAKRERVKEWWDKNRDSEMMKKRNLKISKSKIGKELSEEHKRKVIKNLQKALKALIKKPNKPETILINLFKQYNLPYKYVGDGEVVIGRKYPDFINCNGQKKIIEMFGDYWHNNKNTKWHQTEFGTKSIYSQYGFKTLIIWQSELNDMGKVLERIIKFENA